MPLLAAATREAQARIQEAQAHAETQRLTASEVVRHFMRPAERDVPIALRRVAEGVWRRSACHELGLMA